ncbi:MAG: co-chaperone GroES [Bacteroidales bacterium]|nr:co-chaperone GroES [Bacteroidales bacterium]
MNELQPINQNVLLDMSDEAGEQVTSGGIIIPDTAKEKKKWAKVLAISTIENAEISVGEVVLFKEYSGTHVDFEGKKYLLVPYADILAKIVETEEI